jgi:hypothetical protein
VRKTLIALVGAVVLAGAAVAAVPIIERHAADRIKTEVERDGVTKVGAVEVGLLDRRIALIDLKSKNDAELSVDRWEASGLAWPLGELLRGRTPLSGFRWGDPLRADRMELHKVSIVDSAAGGRWTMDSLVVEGFDLARFDGTYRGPHTFEVQAARALGALTVRRLEQRNALFAMPATYDTFGVASLVIDRYEKGRVAGLSVKSFEAALKDDATPLFKVDDITASRLDWSKLLAGLSSDEWHPGAPVGRVHADNFRASGFSGSLLSRYGLSLAGMSLETTHESDKLSRSRTRIEDFVLAPSLVGREGLQMRLALQSMGLKEVKLDFDCANTEDRNKGEFDLSPCTLVGPGLAQVDFASRIVHADDAFWRAIDDGDAAALGQSSAGLGSARLVLADKSLLERSLKALSIVTGHSPAETRAELARDVRHYQPPGVLITDAMTTLLDTVARFIEQGGTLTIEARPGAAVDLARLQALARPGADLVDALGLTATLSK